MQFTQNQGQDGVVIALQGDFTFNDHHGFRTVLDTLASGSGRRHVLDLSGVGFLDSAALGMLLLAEDEAKKARWTLTLRRPSPQVARLLELTAMDSIFTIEK
jgi:HptB-dependent secretion and biofilm anti anti-sigma factor